MGVGEAVGVDVGVDDVCVGVGVGVGVADEVDVDVCVGVGVGVAVGVADEVAVDVCVGVFVGVAVSPEFHDDVSVGVGVGVSVPKLKMGVSVGVAVLVGVAQGADVDVGVVPWAGGVEGVPVPGTGVGVPAEEFGPVPAVGVSLPTWVVGGVGVPARDSFSPETAGAPDMPPPGNPTTTVIPTRNNSAPVTNSVHWMAESSPIDPSTDRDSPGLVGNAVRTSDLQTLPWRRMHRTVPSIVSTHGGSSLHYLFDN